jgi:hypothetical protein
MGGPRWIPAGKPCHQNRVTKTVETVGFQFGGRLTFRSRGRPQYAICGISVTEV